MISFMTLPRRFPGADMTGWLWPQYFGAALLAAASASQTSGRPAVNRKNDIEKLGSKCGQTRPRELFVHNHIDIKTSDRSKYSRVRLLGTAPISRPAELARVGNNRCVPKTKGGRLSGARPMKREAMR
jgi:hypothetical protein